MLLQQMSNKISFLKRHLSFDSKISFTKPSCRVDLRLLSGLLTIPLWIWNGMSGS